MYFCRVRRPRPAQGGCPLQYFKLHLIRHGLTRGNLEGRYIGGGTDLPLCSEGRAQLQALTEQFDYPAAGVVFTSDRKSVV